MLDIVRSLYTQVNSPPPQATGAAGSGSSSGANAPPPMGRKKLIKKDHTNIKEAIKPNSNSSIIPPAPAEFPEMDMVRFDEMQADLLEITYADKFSFSGFQLGWMSVVDNVWMFGQNFHAGKKDEKMGDEKTGWTYQTAIVPTPGVTLSGRYSSDATSMGINYDTLFGPLSLTINLSEQPEKHLWDISFMTGFARACISFKTQSFIYHSISWATWLWENVFFGTEVQMVPWLPGNAPPQSRIKMAGTYSLGKSRHAFLSYSTGNLGKTTQEIGLGFVRQFSDIFQMACSYDLIGTQDQRWKSVLKLGYLLQVETPQTLFQVKGYIDSALKLVCLGNHPLGNGLSMTYSAKFDYLKNIYDLGLGVNIAPRDPTNE